MKREIRVEIDGAVVIKSSERRRSVAFRWMDGQLVLRVPERFTRKQIDEALRLAREHRARKEAAGATSPKELEREAAALNAAHLAGVLTWQSLGFAQMDSRWGSCTPGRATIRISERLASIPAWVRQAVLHHELCHLLEPGHGPAFQALMNRYPLRSQADDYLALLQRTIPDWKIEPGPAAPEEIAPKSDPPAVPHQRQARRSAAASPQVGHQPSLL